MELRTGRLSGFEVLARWEQPSRGAFLPRNLIELAETNGLIGEVARQVFTKAFKVVGAVSEPLKLSVNLSPVQLADDDFTRQLEAMAAGSGFPLDRLTIEITESALLSDLTRAQRVVHELKELGCHVSLDDFGTGYSSLAHLHSLPFDELKIDRSFVGMMTSKRESRKIVAAIIGLGHSLGLSTVAEGIETGEQADMLLSLGSELGQGWHYGRPSPFPAIRALVAEPTRPASAGLAGSGGDGAVSSLEAFPTQRLAQLQAIYDGAPVGLCFVDAHLRYLSINRRLAEMNEVSVGGHLGRTIDQILPHVFPKIEPYLTRALKGEAIQGVEIERPRRNSNEVTWILVSYQPAFDESNEVLGISISVIDITEMKLAREELWERELMHRHLAELNRQTPWMMDAEGNNLETGSTGVRTTSFATTHETRNLDWLKALHVDDLKPTIQKMKRSLRTGEKIDMEYRVQDQEGEWRWMRSRGLPRFGPDGEITRWYGSVEDIHDKKCAEAEAHKTETTLLALLKAVPVAIIIEEGKQRAVHLGEAVHARSAQHLLHIPASAEMAATSLQSMLPPAAKILDHVFQEGALKSASTSTPVPAGRKRKTADVDIGLEIVSDIRSASEERQRLVSMLEEFADHRTEPQRPPSDL